MTPSSSLGTSCRPSWSHRPSISSTCKWTLTLAAISNGFIFEWGTLKRTESTPSRSWISLSQGSPLCTTCLKTQRRRQLCPKTRESSSLLAAPTRRASQATPKPSHRDGVLAVGSTYRRSTLNRSSLRRENGRLSTPISSSSLRLMCNADGRTSWLRPPIVMKKWWKMILACSSTARNCWNRSLPRRRSRNSSMLYNLRYSSIMPMTRCTLPMLYPSRSVKSPRNCLKKRHSF